MNKILLGTLCTLVSSQVYAGTVQALRDRPIDAPSTPPKSYKWDNDGEHIARNYPQQPPVIPHSIEGHTIDLKTNKCMTCHGKIKTDKTAGKHIGSSHFSNREGEERDQVASRRYVCTTCHVPQSNAPVLVENVFKGGL